MENKPASAKWPDILADSGQPIIPHATEQNQLQLVTIRQLDAVLDEYLQWLNKVNRVFIAGAKPEWPLLVAPDAHRNCVFGAWYYTLDRSQHLPWLDRLDDLAARHEIMHNLARLHLWNHETGLTNAREYDRFTEAAYHFGTAARTFQSDLVHTVCLVDPLTGTWNRTSMFQKLAEEYNRMQRHGASCCLCMMDLDNFKFVNDHYGHPTGDRVLKEVALIAARHLRSYDALFRYGGEEFLFCLPMVTLAEASAAMERVRADIAVQPTEPAYGYRIRVTASFGVAEMLPTRSIEENIEAADRAVYQAKARGRNQVCSH